MKKMKRFLAMFLVVTTLCTTGILTTGAAAAEDRETKAQVLSALGLFKGYDNTGTNFGLSNGATREHAILFLIRMLGEEKAAAAWTGTQPFSDVPADNYYYSYIGYAKAKGYTNGLGNNKFGLGQSANMKQMTAFALRGLGYSETAGDFTYQNSLVFAKSKGILDSSVAPASFTRGHAVDVLFGATFSNVKNQSFTLVEKLAANGAVTEAQLDKANDILDGKTGPKSDLPNGTYTMGLMGNYIRVTSGNALELRNSTPAQTFKVTNQSGGDAYIQTADGYYVGLTKLTNGTQLVLGSTPYSWLIQKQSGGAYTIRPYEKQSMVVNASEEKSANGTNVIIWTHSGAPKNTLITMKASNNVAVTGIKLDQTTATVAVGKTIQLTGTISPANATKQDVTWSSSASSIATVSSTGVVKGIKVGTATITVKTADGGKTATCKVTVTATETYVDKKLNLYNSSKQNVTDVRISSTQNRDWGSNLTSGAIKPDASVAILIPVSSSDYTYDIRLTYADGSQATFEAYNFKSFTSGGSLYAYLDESNTPILSTSKPGAKVAVTGIKLDQTNATVAVGETGQITGTISPSNATNKSVTWTSSNTSVATVDSNGVVTGVKTGTATITAKTVDGSKTATCTITVTGGADTTADSAKLLKRYNTVVARFNTTQETLKSVGLYTGTLKTDWENFAKQLNTNLGFIGSGRDVYTVEQITTANVILDEVDKMLNDMDKVIAEAKATAPTTITVPVTFVNNTGVAITGIFFTPTSVKDWGTSMGSLNVGDVGVVNINVDSNSLEWDLKLVDGNNNQVEFSGLDFSGNNASGITITLTMQNDQVTASW